MPREREREGERERAIETGWLDPPLSLPAYSIRPVYIICLSCHLNACSIEPRMTYDPLPFSITCTYLTAYMKQKECIYVHTHN
jgi:hypothetical protein